MQKGHGKNMKRLIVLLTAVIMLLTFGACSSGQTPAEAEHTENPSIDEITGEAEEEPAEEEEIVPMNAIDPAKPVIALTFDDGPNMTNSVLILDELEARGVVATYFIIGGNINDHTAEVMRRAYALGCEYANHSWGWGSMGSMEADDIIKSLTDTSDKIAEVLGEDARPRFFRAPNLNTSPDMIEVVKNLGYPLMQGITGNDWEGSATPESIFELVVPKAADGSIILLHDGGSNNATAEGIGAILDALLEDGFQFVTLSELFEIKGIEPEAGKTYNDVR
ncbi:MAG: polysaccharide deacetylase family protein [Oscillospiraceae bacterium]|nr:polysaccharide deacetylase family protein [Oscillospiraceae bacterium]